MRKSEMLVISPLVADFFSAHLALCATRDDGAGGKYEAAQLRADLAFEKLSEEQRGYAAAIAAGLGRLLEPESRYSAWSRAKRRRQRQRRATGAKLRAVG